MSAFIQPPGKIPFYLRLGIWISKKVTGKDLLPPRLLAWYPKAAVSSGILELLAAHGDGTIAPRMLKLVRLQASLAVACPFCIDTNSLDLDKHGINAEELSALQGTADISQVGSFTDRERVAVAYARALSQTPPSLPESLVRELTEIFSPREIVILATTAAQVNYWARLLEGLGVPPAGFADNCALTKISPDNCYKP
jgi:alkylhydroperoxidase family enzyme